MSEEPHEAAFNVAFGEAFREAWDAWWEERLREALEGEPGEEPAGLFGNDGDG